MNQKSFPNNKDITLLLKKIHAGDLSSKDRLVNLVYEDLKRIASRQRRKILSNTINTTGLVHEAWLKIQNKDMNFSDRNHFMAVATLAMRHLLVNEAKKKQQLKRKNQGEVTYSSELIGNSFSADWLIDLDKALEKLKDFNHRLEQVFQMIFFAGFTEKEVADYLQINERTVRRDWVKAKLMLSTKLN
jgi:RNA polymerase sigma factor (TIGR02999 family)